MRLWARGWEVGENVDREDQKDAKTATSKFLRESLRGVGARFSLRTARRGRNRERAQAIDARHIEHPLSRQNTMIVPEYSANLRGTAANNSRTTL